MTQGYEQGWALDPEQSSEHDRRLALDELWSLNRDPEAWVEQPRLMSASMHDEVIWMVYGILKEKPVKRSN